MGWVNPSRAPRLLNFKMKTKLPLLIDEAQHPQGCRATTTTEVTFKH